MLLNLHSWGEKNFQVRNIGIFCNSGVKKKISQDFIFDEKILRCGKFLWWKIEKKGGK